MTVEALIINYHHPIVIEVVEGGKGDSYCERYFPRTHYEDMWSSCEKCQEIVKMKWVEECNWKQGNVVELFKETTKNSMADLLLWSSEEFGGKEKKLKKLIKELKDKAKI